ncbi:MAG: carbon-nitrogen hydrolase family protein [bacterium]
MLLSYSLIMLEPISFFTFCLSNSEMVINQDFSIQSSDGLPENWMIWKPILPQASCQIKVISEGLLMDAPNKPFAVGGVYQNIKGIRENTAYSIKTECQLFNIAPQSILVRVYWMKNGNLIHPAGMFARGPIINGNMAIFEDVLVPLNGANEVQISIELKWPQGGHVIWKNVSFFPTSLPKPRNVKIGTVYLRPSNSTPENNLKLWCEQIDNAGKLGLDIVCLGECITSVGTTCTVKDCAKTIPGEDTEILGNAARRNHIWVVAGLTELDGDNVYNTAVLIDRNGNLAGKYRKVHLPREEWKQGVTPGKDYPVFKTDFGTIAMQICYDWFFPETETIFALKGAEIIFAPTWGNTLPDHDGIADGETVFRVRARDNGVYMVPSVYDGNSLVIDPMGRILTSSNGKEGVFWAEVDLNNRELLDWVGYWRSIGHRHRMIETYHSLLEYPKKPIY